MNLTREIALNITAFQVVPYLIETVISAIVIIIGFTVNRLIIQKSIDKLSEKRGLDIQHIVPLRRFASLILWLIISLILLGIFGLTDVLWGIFAAAGFTGIVIGMATRDVVSDILTGMLLHFYRPFKIGDAVAIGDIGGKVQDIGAGGVKIKAWSGEIVIIPNSMMRTSIVRNYSIDSRRATMIFYVDYTSDFNRTLKICKKTLDETPGVMKDPTPTIRVDDFTEKSVKILILVWFPMDKFWNGYAQVKKGLAEEFKRSGLKVPVIKWEERPQEF